MKTLKLTKLLSLVLACVLLMGAFGTLPVFAADSDATIEIVGKNIAFRETISLAYRVECSDPDAEIEVLLYDAEGTLLGTAPKTVYEVDGVEKVAYISAGVPAHKIDTVITAVATIKGTDIKSAPVEYSVLEYLFERLEVDAKAENTDVTAEQIAMYEALMTYAVASELVLEEVEEGKDPDRISDYTYLAVAEEGKDVDGKIVKNGTVIYELATTLVAGENETLWWTFKNSDGEVVATMTDDDLTADGYAVDDVTIAVPSVLANDVEPEAPEIWKLVTDVSTLTAGTQIVIVASDSNYALSTKQNKNNRGQAAVTKDGETVTFGDDVQVITLETGTVDKTFAFNVGEGYLYAASSGSNYLKTETTLSDNSSWKIEIDSATGVATITAQGLNTRNWMQYNQSSSLFACYAAGKPQKDICIYALTTD